MSNPVLAFFARTRTGYHRTQTRDSAGRAIVTEEAFTFSAHIYPATDAQDLMALDGERYTAGYVCLTNAELLLGREGTDQLSDHVVHQSERHKVVTLADRSDNPLPAMRQRRYLLVRVTTGG